MQINTGASLSVINKDTPQKLGRSGSDLQEVQVYLQTYTKEEIPILGSCNRCIHYQL